VAPARTNRKNASCSVRSVQSRRNGMQAVHSALPAGKSWRPQAEPN
jgi:hypothetical protein